MSVHCLITTGAPLSSNLQMAGMAMGCICLRKIHYFRMFEAFTYSWLWGAASCAASGQGDWVQKIWIVSRRTKPAISYNVTGF
jgi:hypothetical protein